MLSNIGWIVGMAWLGGSLVGAWALGRVIALRDRQVPRVAGREVTVSGGRLTLPQSLSQREVDLVVARWEREHGGRPAGDWQPYSLAAEREQPRRPGDRR